MLRKGILCLLERGNYDGPFNDTLRITKTISLIGEDASTTKLTLHPAWVTEWMFASELSYFMHSIQIDAKDVKLVGFTLFSDGWDMQVNGDGAQIMSNIITINVVMNCSHQTCAYNTVTYSCYPNGTAKFYGTILHEPLTMADILILTQKATIGATMLVPIQTEMSQETHLTS